MTMSDIEYNEKLPNFCTNCGGDMKACDRIQVKDEYDSDTGALNEKYRYVWKCESLFRNLIVQIWYGSMGHDDFVVIDRPNYRLEGRAIRTIRRNN